MGSAEAWKKLYEGLMMLLALVSVSLIWIDLGWFNAVVYVVWAIFVVDIAVRVYKARSRWVYLLKHPFDIVSVIPLDSFFLVARFARVLSVLRLRAFLERYITGIKNRFIRLSFGRATLVFLIAIIALNLAVMHIQGYGVLETIRWSFLSMYIFDYGSGINSTAILLVTLALKVVYLLYVGFVVNLLFNFLLRYQDELIRWFYRFRQKEQRRFFEELSRDSRQIRLSRGDAASVNESLMKQATDLITPSMVKEAAERNAKRGLCSIYFKNWVRVREEEEVDRPAGSLRPGVRGYEVELDAPDGTVILTPEDLMNTEAFKALRRRQPFLELYVSVYNAPDYLKGEASWFEIRGYWEAYIKDSI